MLRHIFAVLLFALSFAALAGEFYEKDGAALDGFDAVTYFSSDRPLRGNAQFSHVYKGSTFLFASQANRDTFAAAPEKYAPQYNGYCAYGAAYGGKYDADPTAYSIVDGKLYMNKDASVQKLWQKDVPSHIQRANAKWPGIASGR